MVEDLKRWEALKGRKALGATGLSPQDGKAIENALEILPTMQEKTDRNLERTCCSHSIPLLVDVSKRTRVNKGTIWEN